MDLCLHLVTMHVEVDCLKEIGVALVCHVEAFPLDLPGGLPAEKLTPAHFALLIVKVDKYLYG